MSDPHPIDDPLPASPWLDEALAGVAADPDTVGRAFAFAARKVGRAPVNPDADPTGVVHGTVDDAARAALVVALVAAVGDERDAADRLATLYRQGDAAERRGVLRGLDTLQLRGELGEGPLVDTGRELAADALRTNDQGLVAAAVGPFGSRYLDQHTWRHALLKLVFMGVSLDAAHGLEARSDAELARMARDFAAERRAAGRTVPADVDRLDPSSTTSPRE